MIKEYFTNITKTKRVLESNTCNLLGCRLHSSDWQRLSKEHLIGCVERRDFLWRATFSLALVHRIGADQPTGDNVNFENSFLVTLVTEQEICDDRGGYVVDCEKVYLKCAGIFHIFIRIYIVLGVLISPMHIISSSSCLKMCVVHIFNFYFI